MFPNPIGKTTKEWLKIIMGDPARELPAGLSIPVKKFYKKFFDPILIPIASLEKVFLLL
jgi:hypothetical protein